METVTIGNQVFIAIMNKIHRLRKVLTDLRSLNVLRANSTSARYFSTSKDLEGETKDAASTEPVIEKEIQAEMKENAEISEFNTKLSGFAQSYERFSHIDDKIPETPQTFVSLIRNSKFVDVNIPCLMYIIVYNIYIYSLCTF